MIRRIGRAFGISKHQGAGRGEGDIQQEIPKTNGQDEKRSAEMPIPH